jgi:hypothetical protein
VYCYRFSAAKVMPERIGLFAESIRCHSYQMQIRYAILSVLNPLLLPITLGMGTSLRVIMHLLICMVFL